MPQLSLVQPPASCGGLVEVRRARACVGSASCAAELLHRRGSGLVGVD